MNYPEHTKFLPDEDKSREGESLTHEFEPVSVSECDECGVEAQLNKFGLCRPCDAHSEAFISATGKAALEGKSKHEQYLKGESALFQCLKSSNPLAQVMALNKLVQ